jgi:hypothetical protein
MALRDLPLPYELDWLTWVDSVVAANPAAVRVVTETVALTWREVAERLTMVEPQVPAHDPFETWQEWAANLKAVFPY